MAVGVGIDIGHEYVKVVQASVSKNSVTILKALKFPRNKGSGDDDDGGAFSVPAQLGEELKKAGIRRSGTVGVSGREVTLKYLATPPMPPDKIRMVTDMEIAGKLTSRGGEEETGPAVTYDFRILNTPSGLKGDLILMANVCKNEFLQQVFDGMKGAGAAAEKVVPSAFGVLNSYLRTQQIREKETAVVIDVGHELMEVCILEENNVFFARSAAGGGKKFTAALEKILGPGMGEEYKHEKAEMVPEGTPIQDKDALMMQNALKEGAENIAGAIRSALMMCRTQAKMPKLDYQRLYICGGGAKVKGLPAYLEKKLNKPVQVLDLGSAVDARKLDAASAKCFEGDVPDMAVALGLAICDADPDTFQLALVPEKIVKMRTFLRKTVFGIAAGVVMVASLVPAWNNAAAAVEATAQQTDFYAAKNGEAQQEKKSFYGTVEENRVQQMRAGYYARQTRLNRVQLNLFSKLRAETPRGFQLTYFGPEQDGQNMTSAALRGWAKDNEPQLRLSMIGYYDAELYPGTKFNDTWEILRQKLLEVPGVANAQVETSNEPTDGKARGTNQAFHVKLTLLDDSKAVLENKTPAASAAPSPVSPPALQLKPEEKN